MSRILILSSRIPYPPNAGFRKRIFKFSQVLSKKHYVELICFRRGKSDKIVLEKLKQEMVFKKIYDFNLSTKDILTNVIFNLSKSLPLQVKLYTSNKIKRWLLSNYQNYDLIIFNHVRMAEYAKIIPANMMIDYHDSLALHYEDGLKKASGFMKMIYFLESKKLKEYEKSIADLFAEKIITSKVDANYIGRNDIKVIPMWYDDLSMKESKKVSNTKEYILFVGKMNYYPNEDAVIWFVNNVFNKLRKQFPKLKFRIVGSSPSKKVKKLCRIHGVEVVGFVDDLESEYRNATLVIAPVRIGAGILNKIIEAMAYGKCVITFPQRVAPIEGAIDSFNIVTAKDENEFLKKIKYYLLNQNARETIGYNAQLTAEKKYKWSVISARFLQLIDDLLKKSGGQYDN